MVLLYKSTKERMGFNPDHTEHVSQQNSDFDVERRLNHVITAGVDETYYLAGDIITIIGGTDCSYFLQQPSVIRLLQNPKDSYIKVFTQFPDEVLVIDERGKPANHLLALGKLYVGAPPEFAAAVADAKPDALFANKPNKMDYGPVQKVTAVAQYQGSVTGARQVTVGGGGSVRGAIVTGDGGSVTYSSPFSSSGTQWGDISIGGIKARNLTISGGETMMTGVAMDRYRPTSEIASQHRLQFGDYYLGQRGLVVQRFTDGLHTYEAVTTDRPDTFRYSFYVDSKQVFPVMINDRVLYRKVS